MWASNSRSPHRYEHSLTFDQCGSIVRRNSGHNLISQGVPMRSSLSPGIVKLVILLIILSSSASAYLQTKKPPPRSATTVVQTPANQPDPAQKKKPTQIGATQLPNSPPPTNPGPQRTSIQIIPDKTVVQRGELVTFRLVPEQLVSHTAYRFDFDFNEGARETMDRSRGSIQHRFTSTGQRTVSAFAIAPPGVAPDEEGIQPITITVMQVKLSAEPLSTEVGVSVSFSATLVSTDSNLRYRFSFGDGKQTDWQASNKASHTYTTAGSYKPTVDVGFVDARTALTPLDSNSSDQVNVKLPSVTSLTFRVAPARVKTDEDVKLSASFLTNGRQIQYRFDFGDGATSDWLDSGAITHKYAIANTYEPSVEVRGLVDGTEYPIIKSPSRTITVTPGATVVSSPVQRPSFQPTPDPNWPPYVIPLLIAVLVVGGLLFATILGIGGYKTYRWLFPPEPAFVPHMDIGTASTDHGASTPLIDFEVQLNANTTSGSYGVLPNGPLIISQRSRP